MRYLAIFELLLISLGLIGLSLYLLIADTGPDTNESSMMKSLRSGQLNAVSLVAVDKYETGGRKNSHYIILSGGPSQSDITRLVSKKTFKSVNIGELYSGYDMGSDYMIPAFDNLQTVDSWKLYAGTMAGFFAFAFILAAYKLYKHGRLKDIMRFEMGYQLSGF